MVRTFLGHVPTTVATSALGAVGARGVGAAEVDLDDVQRIGMPRHSVVNVETSKVLTADVLRTHRDIHRRDVATLILLAAGLLEGGPDGVRSKRLTPLARA